MSDSDSRDEFMDYLEHWSPSTGVNATTNGVLVQTNPHTDAATVHKLFQQHGWVIDQIHWSTQAMHLVPKEVLDDA